MFDLWFEVFDMVSKGPVQKWDDKISKLADKSYKLLDYFKKLIKLVEDVY